MYKYFPVLLLSISLFSCSSESRKNEYSIIVKNFLQVVDTVGYKTFSLRAAPSDSLNYLKTEYKNCQPGIIITDSLLEWNKFKVGSIDISKYVSMSEIDDFKVYNELIETGKKYKSINNVANFFPSKIDKYYLSFNHADISTTVKITGHVTFSRVLIRNHIAAFLGTISTGNRSGITKLFLLERKGDEYVIIRHIDLVVW